MDKQIDKLEHGFANAGTTRPHGRAQRMVDRTGGVDAMAEEGKIRPRIRRHRVGAAQQRTVSTGIKPVPKG